jgi:hypothetical protein
MFSVILFCFNLKPVSEIFAPLLGRHQELMLHNLRRRRAFGHESEFEVSDNFVDDFMVF